MGKCFSVCVVGDNCAHKTSKVVQVQQSVATNSSPSSGLVKHNTGASGDVTISSNSRNKRYYYNPPKNSPTYQSDYHKEESASFLPVSSANESEPISLSHSNNGFSRMPFGSKSQVSSVSNVIQKSVDSLRNKSSNNLQHQSRSPDQSNSNTDVSSSSKRLKLTKNTFEDNVRSIFKHYQEYETTDQSDPNILGLEGVVQFLSEVQLDPEDFRVLVFAWKCNAKNMCQFSWEEFLHGFYALRVDSVTNLAEKLSVISHDIIKNSHEFNAIYKWAFDYALEHEKRSLLKPYAIAMWRVLFSLDSPPIFNDWINFVSSNDNYQVITRDTWNMFIRFITIVGSDFSQYTESDAWPTLMDEFVESVLDSNTNN